MLAIELSDLLIELKEGAIRNVGPSNKSGTAKLFDVERAGAREFGDGRVKLVFADGEGNEVQVALFPEHARDVLDDLEGLAADSTVFE